MPYSVKQLSDLAGVSARTLHFYDQIGLLRPSAHGENGYRYYGEEALLRLQQILFFKELDFSLAEIQEIVDRPGFDIVRALGAHRDLLEERASRLKRLIHTVDKTILHLKGELDMSENEYYEGFSEEKQKEYAQEARQRYGEAAVQESENRWNRLTAEQKAAKQAESDAITRAIVAHMAEGPAAPEVQRLIGRMHEGMNFYYDCSYEIFQGLGHMYNEDERFKSMYEKKYHPDLPGFLEQAITYYCAHRPAGAR
jgi:MerR family transcriptional regulator, thiopeptide resistance regulator